MKNRIVILVAIVMLIISLFTACKTDENVNDIIQEPTTTEKESAKANATYMASEGETFILFNTDFLAALKQDVNQSMRADYPEFDTLSEMKAYIKAGDFTDSEILTFIHSGAIDTAGRLEVFDIEKLHDITLPMGFLKGKFSWGLDDYSVTISDGVISGIAYILDRDSYEFFTKEETEDVLQEYQQILSDELVLERDARVVHYKNQSAELKRIHYTLENNGTCLYIYEVYTLQFFYDAGEVVSERIPQSIRIAGENKDGYFYAYLSGFKERPSVEWLSSFGIVDYVEEGTEAAVK